MQYFKYYGKHKRYNETVLQNNLVQDKTLQVRIDGELVEDIKSLSHELVLSESKVVRDILHDFFLEKHHREWQKEVNEW